MPNIIEITDFHAPELDPYARLTQNQLRNRLEPEKGIFIAESPKVIDRALDAGYKPVSLLMERILNPGGYAHYSVAILDALRLCGVPAVEVLLSEPDEHEPFRKTDIVSFGCQGHFIGEGISGYLHAAAYLAQLLRLDGSAHTHLVM